MAAMLINADNGHSSSYSDTKYYLKINKSNCAALCFTSTQKKTNERANNKKASKDEKKKERKFNQTE